MAAVTATMDFERIKFTCPHPGCSRSYLRSEHLNRHMLIHKAGAFLCYLCDKRFTRNDLLHAHLRRHEKRARRDSTTSTRSSSSKKSTPPRPAGVGAALPSSKSAAVTWRMPPEPFNMPRPSSITLQTDPRLLGGFAPDQSINPTVSIYPGPSDNATNVQNLDLQQANGFFTATDQSYLLQDGATELDYTWLFQEDSLFDLPPEDYLNLHFGGGLGNTPPDVQGIAMIEGGNYQGSDVQFATSDSQTLLNACPELASTPLHDHATIVHVLRLALDYCDVFMPFFHRPTLVLASLQPPLLLALCSLGLFLSKMPEAYETGKLLQKHVWRTVFGGALDVPRVEMWILQTMVIMEHISVYALTRHEHEMAEIAHSMIVTLARRNNLLGEALQRTENAPRQSTEVKWKEWANRETIIRLAHTIFVHDIQYTMHFTHHSTLSVTMMKLPLPSPTPFFTAPTAQAWSALMRQTKKPPRAKYNSLQTSIAALLSLRDPATKRDFHTRFAGANNPTAVANGTNSGSSALLLHILIHGLSSALWEDKYRSVDSSSSPATRLLKAADFDDALAHWLGLFQRLPPQERSSRLAETALTTYHLSCILLRSSLADVQMAAGAAYSFGRAVTPARAQAAYTRLVTTDPVSWEVYRHGAEIAAICLRDGTDDECPEPRPLWQTYVAFLGTLVLWARTLAMRSEAVAAADTNSARDEATEEHQTNRTSAISGGVDASEHQSTALASLFGYVQDQHPSSHGEDHTHGVLTTNPAATSVKSDIHFLLQNVRDKLADAHWEISHEARRILSNILDREATAAAANNGNGENGRTGSASKRQPLRPLGPVIPT